MIKNTLKQTKFEDDTAKSTHLSLGHWPPLASMISRSFQTVKPGSHMPRSYLRHSCRCCLRHRSDMRTEVAGNRSHVSLYHRHACEVDSSLTSQACRGKDCDVSCCRRHYVLICRRSIADTTDSYVAGTSEAYENQA